MIKPSNIKSIETGSGIAWDVWLGLLDPYKDLNHTEMANIALDEIRKVGASTSPEWWAQGVTVAYEQHIGRRQPGQTSAGDYSVTVSKTLEGDMTDVVARVVERLSGVDAFDGINLLRPGAVSETKKWRYWRCGLADGSTVSINIQTKPSGDTSSVAINHDKLRRASDVQRWRGFWKTFDL